MPLKIKHIFEREYGKKKGDRIFYAWENKQNMAHKRHERLEQIKRHSSELVLRGNKKYLNYMKGHLSKEHPKTKGHIFINSERRN